jgi:Domain of unknown function (DUF2017)
VSGAEGEALAGFRAASGGPTARFAAAQATIIRDLVGQVAELITADMPDGGKTTSADNATDELAAQLGLSESTQAPADPVLARLLPDAYTGDEEASSEFRRYTEQGLRSAKIAAARTVLATLPPSGGKVRLSEPEAQAWLRALNDVRLALGVRLGITEEPDEQEAELSPDDPEAAYMWVFQWLAFLQESLVEALS